MSSTLKVDILQDSGGNNIIASDGSGNLTTQKILYPAFEAYLSSSQTVSDATNTKVQIDTELFDTDNCYDNSTNYRFTPTVAGKYFVYVRLTFQSSSTSDLRDGELRLFKNGLEYSTTDWRFSANDIQTAGTTLNTTVDMNGSTDYLELYGYNNVVSGTPSFSAGSSSEKSTLFGAYRIGD